MRILLSAYWCEPDCGSEAEIGLQALLAAASRHEVWLLTREESVGPIHRFLAGRTEGARVHVEGIATSPVEQRSRLAHIARFHTGHDQWQREALRRARALDARIDFDVVHHVTVAAYWVRAGVASLGKPFVWGPLGGGVEPPPGLLTELGPAGLAEDLARVAGRRLMARTPSVRGASRAADVILVNNADTRRRLPRGHHADTTVLPHGIAATVDPAVLNRRPAEARRTTDVACVGRLIPWKATQLALRALRHLHRPEVTLRVAGDGPERERLERTARRWGLDDRLVFTGRLSREDLHRWLATCACLVHPALHDDSPLTVAEALQLGTPVVALDHGGPAELARVFPRSPVALVRPTTPERTAARLAAAIDGFLAAPPPVPRQPLVPTVDFRHALLDAYERAAARGRSTLEQRSPK